MNSLYGTFGNVHSPFYDIDAAASVTYTGQSCIKEAAEITSRFMKANYDIDDNCTVYGDTDSVYVSIDMALMKLGIPLTEDGNVSKGAYDIATKLENET